MMNELKQPTVTHYYREPRPTGVSIEGIFTTVKQDLAGLADIKDFYCDGKKSRIGNINAAGLHTSDINHITGDVNFLALGLNKGANMLTIHDFGYYENPVHPWWRHQIYKLFWFTLPLRKLDLVTVVSEFTGEKLRQYFNYAEDRIRVIPDPVKPAFRRVERAGVRNRPVVLMLGSGKHKNLDGLIAAVRGLDVHLDLVGWPAKDELERLAAYKISHTIYNRLTDEQVLERYAQCDILYIASHYEGFGMPIIEAQTVGRPVITSNIGAMLEVGRGSALLVSPGSVDEIRAAIVRLTDDMELYNNVVMDGYNNAMKYEHRRVSMQYLEVYRALM